MIKRVFFTVSSLALLVVSSSAQPVHYTSAYSSMSLAGDWTGWNPSANNMYLVSNGVWETVMFLTPPTNGFKFTANGGWTDNWGSSGKVGQAPMTGTVTKGGGNITLTNLTDGFYRFRLDETANQFRVELLGYVYNGENGNLVRNGGFDIADAVNTNEAYGWKWRPAMAYGDRFGNSGWVDWRYRSALKEMFVGQGGGGVWQDAPAGEDFDYEFSAWFWMDGPGDFGPWTSAVQEVKIEFFDARKEVKIGEIAAKIPFNFDEDWHQAIARGPAPTNTAWARATVNVSGGGNRGTLQIDDLAMRAIPRQNQYFEAWNFKTTGTLVRGGWSAAGAAVVTNTSLAYIGRSLALRTNGSIRSPYIDAGIERIEFRYRNGNAASETNNAPVDPVSVEVRVSPTGTGDTFQSVATISDIIQQSYGLFSLTLPSGGSEQHVLDIRVTAGTNLFLIDNIEILPRVEPGRSQNFSAWTNSYLYTNGCHTFDFWTLCTGRVFDVGAFTAPSAVLPRPAGGHTNYLQSPLLEEGYGTISLKAARGTNGSAPGVLWVQESPDAVTWTTVHTSDPIGSPTWMPYEFSLYQPEPRYVRLVNASASNAASGPSVLIDEGFGAGATPPDGWTFTRGIDVYTSAGNFGREAPSLKLQATGHTIETPELVNPTNVYFWLKGQTINPASQLNVEALVGGTWQVVRGITGMINSATTTNIAVPSSATRIRFVYQLKAGGNISFDDVIIHGAPSGPQPAQDILIDDIVIRAPERAEEVREQNFDTWPTKTQYGNGVALYQGWTITNAIVNTENGFDLQSLRLNNTVGNYIQSPRFLDGIGTISFMYAKWLTDTVPQLAVQYSTNNGATWITLETLTDAPSSSSGYKAYEYTLNLEQPAVFRIYHSAGVGRAMIDNIAITVPQPPADVQLFAYHEPSAPFTNDTIDIMAQLSPLYGARVSSVNTYYRMGTNGAFTALPMLVTNFTQYTTASSLGPYSTGTVVQYYVRVDFTGPGASANSPRFYPADGPSAPAFFAIPRTQSGQVWINEVKYDNSWGWGESAFIELAGPPSFNLWGWSIELYYAIYENGNAMLLFDRYVIQNGITTLSATPPLGFWVLGEQGVDNARMFLTNDLWKAKPLGIKLLNEGGGVEQALSFNGASPDFDQVPVIDDPFDDGIGLSLLGAGTTYSNFTWTTEVPVSPGAMNDGQSYGDEDVSEPPNVWVERVIWTTNITIVTAGNTNSWLVQPYGASSLSGSPTWNPVTPFHSSYENGTNRIWFEPLPGPSQFYRVQFTKP